MLKRLLIANRGEIVCRIASTALRLGVTSIAVYSDADRGARHTRVCDEAYHLGAAAPAESYLNIGKLIELAKRVKADALHPGYGFLSENANLAQACDEAGITFVGPRASAIRAMGSKSASKASMAAVGVPIAPGYHGADQDPVRLANEAARVGFPLIIKASAGGGGKGMQVVNSLAEVAGAVESAKRLARTSFGDDHLLMERYFAKARHVEVQVFADAHGNTVSLFDRDCSVQRRHQKIIEEAPAPGLRDEVRAAMAAAAIKAAQAVGYQSAGTVEFLVDEAQNFYFMEMNTRLQVEHPVTEMISGLDLVEWQLRVASGEALPRLQAQIASQGCAVEARLYAEDPSIGYIPSVGRITHLRLPQPNPGLRWDMGVEAQDEVSSYYDPMLGKVIAWGASREQALQLLHRALSVVEIAGVTTNRALLISVLAEADFRAGAVSTNYLTLHQDQLQLGEPKPEALDLALGALWHATERLDENALWQDRRGWRVALPALSRWELQWGSGTQESASVEVESCSDRGRFLARAQGTEIELYLMSRDAEQVTVEVAGRAVRVHGVEREGMLHLYRSGAHLQMRLRRTEDTLEHADAAEQGSLLTPLPGTVVAVHVRTGQSVTKGAALVTVEAMKMEHTLTAPYEGTVAKIAYGVSDRVAAGAILVELTAT